MRVFLAKHQLVDVDEAVGPIINWDPTMEEGQVESFEQMWAVDSRPEIIPGRKDLASTMQANQVLSRLQSR